MADAQLIDPVMNITVHGMGINKPDYYKAWDVPGILMVPEENVQGFCYDDLMDKDRISLMAKAGVHILSRFYAPRLASLLIDKPVDYLEDVFVFFLSQETRDLIEYRLAAMLERYGKVRLFGYSLGSMVAYWFLLHHPDLAERVELVTLGCPMGSPAIRDMVRFWMRQICDVPMRRPNVRAWYNLASTLDPLSGMVDEYGCRPLDQKIMPAKDKTFHTDVCKYLQAYENSPWRGTQLCSVS